MTTWILRERRHEVTHCNDGGQALDQLPILNPNVIIFDGAMGEDKRCLTVKMYSVLPAVQIIGMHEHVTPSDGRHIRAEAHIHKPFHADDLLELIDELVAAG